MRNLTEENMFDSIVSRVNNVESLSTLLIIDSINV